jgi:putative thioredoxin
MSATQDIVDVSEATFDAEVVEQSRHVPVVVDFWAPWCSPCRMLSPVLERVAQESQGAFRLVKINVDENPGLATRFGVQGIPAVKAFRNGKVVAEFVGAQPEPSVRKFIKGIAPAEMDRALEEAASLLAAQRWAEAEAAYRRAQTATPTSPAAALGLARSLLAQGKGQEAEHWLDDLPDGPEAAVAEKLGPLARLLVEAQSTESRADTGKLDTLFYTAGQLVAQGNISEAMDKLLEVLRQDKRYRQGEPRLVMLALFELLGEDNPLLREYRNKLASVLF